MTVSQKYDSKFASEIYALENGHYIRLCIQCGMCAVSCATRKEMDHSPRKLFMLIIAGMKEEFFRSNTIWMCSSCLLCRVRCPRGIPLVNVMHDLKYYAIRCGYSDVPQASFYQSFWQEVMNRGRVFEGGLMARYYLRRGWSEIKKGFEMRDLGMDMVRHSRLPLKPPKTIKGINVLRKIIEIAQTQKEHREAE